MTQEAGDRSTPGGAPGRPLRIAALVKQIPVAESMELDPEGRLRREGLPLEMNAYCRRAVSEGVLLARASGGHCSVFTLGPPSAEDVLREAIAWGADEGVHICGAEFAGSDTLATARALATALALRGPFDLVLVGRNTLDGDTGQVGPEVAELTGLAFAAGVRQLDLDGSRLELQLEQDDGTEQVELALPAVLSVAERLCEPCKMPPEARQAVPAGRISRLGAADLGPGPWGQAGSPTRVGRVRELHHDRGRRVLSGPLDAQVDEAVRLLEERSALPPTAQAASPPRAKPTADGAAGTAGRRRSEKQPDRRVAVVLEEGRAQVGAELIAAARKLADEVGAEVVALWASGSGRDAGTAGEGGASDTVLAAEVGPGAAELVDRLVAVRGAEAPEDVAGALSGWAADHRPWAVLAPSTAFGREVAARAAAALGAGLVGDAIGVELVDGELVAAKPAFSGALVADITCSSPVQFVSVRPGVLPAPPDSPAVADGAAPALRAQSVDVVEVVEVVPRRRVRRRSSSRDDDVEVLARAEAVIGVGTGVHPDEYPLLSPLAALLGAEMAATRKVTDKGWAPRSRQVGITGRSIAPRMYVAIGLSGKFNHMVGVRGAGTVLAVNADPAAPVFDHADVGIVGDWHEALPLLEAALRRRAASAMLTART